MRPKYYLYHLFIQKKWSDIAYLWVANVCESFGLPVKGEIRVHLCRSVFSQCNDYQMSVRDLFYSKNRDRSNSDHVWGDVNHVTSKGDYWGPWKKSCILLIRLEKVTKPSPKSLDSTNPQSDRLCTNGGNSRPLLPSWEVVEQQRSLQSRTCYSLRGCKSSQGNLLSNYVVHGRVARRKPLFSKN